MTEARRVIVEADGGSRGNPGPAGYGALVRDARTGELLAERKDALGVATNNVAEYNGLIAGLTAARDLGATDVLVRMDSRLVVEQMSGRWQVKHPAMRPLAARAATLVREFSSVDFEWIPRERNTHADRLANEAMDAAAGVPPRRQAPPASRPAVPGPSWAPPGDTPTRLLLVRHGATAHSAEHRFSGRNDLHLDATGERQAAAVAERLAGCAGVASIVTSPLRRARQSADIIAATLRLPVEQREEFAELDFGAWEGLTSAEVGRRYPDEFAAWSATTEAAPPDGESFAALARRVRRGRDALVAAHPGRTVVVVTHVSPIKTLVRLALDAPQSALFHMQLDPGSLTVLDYHDSGEARLRLFNDTGRPPG